MDERSSVSGAPGPGCVFEVGGLAAVGPVGERARRIDLGTDFDELGPAGSASCVSLAPLANELTLRELRRFLHRACFLLREGGELRFVARDPDDVPEGTWPGEPVVFGGVVERYRPLRHFVELLRLFPLRVRTPRAIDGPELGRLGAFHEWRAVRTAEATALERDAPPEERYAGTYRRFDRLEEPETADDLFYAAARLRPRPGERVLALGMNDGRELEMFAPAVRAEVELWGIDHSPAAVAAARERFPTHAERMVEADLAQLGGLRLPAISVVLALNVLQCTSVERDALLRDLKPLLTPDARLLASIPNCHFGPADLLRRPLRRDDPRHDRSLVHKDLRYLTRELYRSGFRTVEAFGTYDAFLLARR